MRLHEASVRMNHANGHEIIEYASWSEYLTAWTHTLKDNVLYRWDAYAPDLMLCLFFADVRVGVVLEFQITYTQEDEPAIIEYLKQKREEVMKLWVLPGDEAS